MNDTAATSGGGGCDGAGVFVLRQRMPGWLGLAVPFQEDRFGIGLRRVDPVGCIGGLLAHPVVLWLRLLCRPHGCNSIGLGCG